jgi:hypothetical protein
VVLLIAAVAGCLVAGCATTTGSSVVEGPAAPPPFSEASPFNVPLREIPGRRAARRDIGAVPRSVNLVAFSPAVYTATPSDPLVRINLRRQGQWGNNRLHGLEINLPGGARPAPDEDGHMTIVLPHLNLVVSLYQGTEPVDGVLNATWGGLARLTGRGGALPNATGGRESGISQLAGLITPDDVRRALRRKDGDLGHALAVGYPLTSTVCRLAPAKRSQGNSRSPAALAMGQRIAVDPRLDVGRLDIVGSSAQRRFARIILRTLQRYGGIVTTRSRALSFQMVNPVSFTSVGRPDPWPDLVGQPRGGYFAFLLDAIPEGAFRAVVPPAFSVPGARARSCPITRVGSLRADAISSR